MESLNDRGVEWGLASLPHPEQSVLGDGYVVKALPDGLMMAVVDGLGHGSEAAKATALCVAMLSASAELPVFEMLRLSHERLRGTRGATASVARFDYACNGLIWSGVGDVMGLLFRGDVAAGSGTETLLSRPGVLGSGAPTPTASQINVRRGDLLVLATDGIARDFERSVDRGAEPRVVAERILADHSKRTDDALVLVARYWGLRA